jgi:nucleotide sugar dehydrogenase
LNSKVSVIGLGYVGLSTAVCFASRRIKTIGVEVNKEKLSTIRSGIVPFHERGLDEMLRQTLDDGTFDCTDDISKAVRNTEITIIAVGTPSRPDGGIELDFVREACAQVALAMKAKRRNHIVVIKSTVVPGTTEEMIKRELESRSGMKAVRDFGLAVNPEFLREGTAVYDTFHPDALILGCSDGRTLSTLKKLFQKFYGKLPVTIETTPTNAELIKYSVNTFRAVQLSFINTLANLASALPNSEVGEVIRGLATITKLDNRYLRPGPGFGGSCLPKDTRAMIAHMRNKGVDPDILESALKINMKQSKVIVNTAESLLKTLKGRKIAVLGLSFKGNTDDIRESPSLNIVRELLLRGAAVSAYDPAAGENAKNILGDSISLSNDAKDCLHEADCCIIATEWTEFSKLKPEDFASIMKEPVIVDARRIFDPEKFGKGGVIYRRIGTSIE